MQWRGLDQSALESLGAQLGRLATPGTVLLMQGPMGAGKTTFTRALGRGLALARPHRVCSPTFNICMVHPGPVPLVHVDLFRLAPDDEGGPAPASFEALGLEPLLDRLDEDHPEADPQAGVLVVEWADLWESGRDRLDALVLRLSRPDPDHRDLEAEALGPRHAALLASWRG